MTQAATPPKMFWFLSGAALLWNLLGVMAFVMQVTMSETAMAALPAAEREIFENFPLWALAAFAVAVFAGALGSLLLLLRKGLAVPVFGLSLAGIIVQQIHGYFVADGLQFGAARMILPLMTLLIAGALIWYANHARSNGWIQ